MNDSISISSSSFSNSSNNSKSNSLNRSELNGSDFKTSNHTLLTNTTDSDANNNVLIVQTPIENKDKLNDFNAAYFIGSTHGNLPHMNLRRRRTKSQVIYNGDDLNTITEQNKLLIEDLFHLKKTLKKKDSIINELNDIRDRLESEMHELSASLFEQAYTMVNTAKAETAQAEKLLKEANGKIDVLQAEVKALKEVVMTTTPSSNIANKHLHPYFSATKTNNVGRHIRQSSLNQQTLNQLNKMNLIPNKTEDSNMPSISCSNNSLNASSTNIVTSQKSLSTSRSEINFQNTAMPPESVHRKTHKRGSSHNDIHLQSPKSFIDKLFHSSSHSDKQQAIINDSLNHTDISNSQQSLQFVETDQECDVEFNEMYFKEISEWRENPDLKESSSFMKRVYEEDILPCLNFNDRKLSENLLNSIRSNCVCIEDLKNAQLSESLPNTCGLSNITSGCEYKIRLNESKPWIYISRHSRNRVISVCDFFTYLRYIKDGLVKCDINEIYWNIIDLRKKICLSRLGL